jgi:hypothetical protein
MIKLVFTLLIVLVLFHVIRSSEKQKVEPVKPEVEENDNDQDSTLTPEGHQQCLVQDIAGKMTRISNLSRRADISIVSKSDKLQ